MTKPLLSEIFANRQKPCPPRIDEVNALIEELSKNNPEPFPFHFSNLSLNFTQADLPALHELLDVQLYATLDAEAGSDANSEEELRQVALIVKALVKIHHPSSTKPLIALITNAFGNFIFSWLKETASEFLRPLGKQVFYDLDYFIQEEFLFPEDTENLDLLLKIVLEMVASYPEEKEKLIQTIQQRLEQFRLNTPSLNAILARALCRLDTQSAFAKLAQAYEEQMIDEEVFSIEAARKTTTREFPLPRSLAIEELNQRFTQIKFTTAEQARIFQSANLQGAFSKHHLFILGYALSPAAKPSFNILMDALLAEDEMGETPIFESKGQMILFATQILNLYQNELNHISRRFDFLEAIEKDQTFERVSIKAARVALAISGFIDGLCFSISEIVQEAILEDEWIQYLNQQAELLFVSSIEPQQDEAELEDLIVDLTNHWDEDYLGFVERMQSLRLANVQMIDHFSTTKTQAGRNDPCPCGSGKKYKKCCLL